MVMVRPTKLEQSTFEGRWRLAELESLEGDVTTGSWRDSESSMRNTIRIRSMLTQQSTLMGKALSFNSPALRQIL